MQHLFYEKTLPVGRLQCNCRLLVCTQTGEGILMDPGDEPELIQAEIMKTQALIGKKILLKFFLHTHAHFDHFGATSRLKEIHPSANIALHSGDEKLYYALKKQGFLFGENFDDPKPVDHKLEDEEKISFGRLSLTVQHTPGHSPGSVSYHLQEDSQLGTVEKVYTGDTLFYRSVGRADLWGGDAHLLIQSIRKRLLIMDDDTIVCPGHGCDSTIGSEKKENPFLK